MIAYRKKLVVKYINRWVFDNAQAFDSADNDDETIITKASSLKTTPTPTATLPKAHTQTSNQHPLSLKIHQPMLQHCF